MSNHSRLQKAPWGELSDSLADLFFDGKPWNEKSHSGSLNKIDLSPFPPLSSVSHHIDEQNAPNTFKKLVKDYAGLTETETGKVIDREILVGIEKTAGDIHPTRHEDIGLYELYFTEDANGKVIANDDWDKDGISNSIEVENGINPFVANPEYTQPKDSSNPKISVERGTYGNGLIENSLRIANINRGYYYFKSADPEDTDNYAPLRGLQIIEAVAGEWEEKYPDLAPLKKDIFVNGGDSNLDQNDDDGMGGLDNNTWNEVRIGIGDISREGGGPFYKLNLAGQIVDEAGNVVCQGEEPVLDENQAPSCSDGIPKLDHATHRNGLSIDVRYPRNNNTEGKINLSKPQEFELYSRELTLELINLFIQHGATQVIIDPLTGITEDPTRIIVDDDRDNERLHFNHLHVNLPIENLPTGEFKLTQSACSIGADGQYTVQITSEPIKDKQ